MSGGVKYRPDIDGLRAVAVTLVVMYHLGVGFTKGGFIGVDVFFVISGYLITSIIQADVNYGYFSLIRFYERRVRRLFPALFCMLIFTSVLGYLVLLPPELEYLGSMLGAVSVFLANILFYHGDNYFAGTNHVVPLLHTWSLAVEEQFYLLYPLALIPLLRQPTALRSLFLGAAAFLSFLLSIFLVRYERSAAFFMLPPRAWELLLGCILGLGLIPAWRSAQLCQWASIVGLLAILISGGAINKNTTFPGWAALAPCIGAAMVIHSGEKRNTLAYRLLSSRYVVFIGLISYSLYLWHWPLIVFYKAYFGFELSDIEKVIIGIASIAIAAVSWRYVERPFRQKVILPRREPLFSVAAAASASTIAVGALLIATEGMSYRFPANVRQLASFRYDPDGPMRTGKCFISYKAYSEHSAVDDACLRLDSKRKNFLLIGDSHAAHHWAGLSAVFPEINFLQATASGCTPVLGAGGAPRCRSVIDRMYLRFIPTHKLDAVVIAAKWTLNDIPALLTTIRSIRGHVAEVYVFGPIVAYTDFLPRLLTRSERLHDASLIIRSRQAGLKGLDLEFRRAVEMSGAKYVSIYKVLCESDNACLTTDASGFPIQFDGAHLTSKGAIMIASMLKDRNILK